MNTMKDCFIKLYSSDRLWFIGLAVIAGIALFCRIISWEHFAWAIDGVPISYSRTLDTMAVNILDGVGFQDRVAYWLYQAFRMPFFSVTLASIYALFGYDYFPARVILCVISSATCLCAAGTGRILFNRSVGFMTGLFFAVYYPLIFLSHSLMTETLSIFLFVQGLYMFLRAVHERSWGFASGSGVVLGLSVMTRFAFVAALPILFLYLLVFSSSWNRKLKLAIVWVALMMAVIAPWIIRNGIVFDTFFPSASGGTRQIWTGANPQYGGVTFSVQAWRDILWADPDASEMQRNKRIKIETTEFIKNNPSWYFSKVIWRAKYHLKIPDFHDLFKGRNGFVVWTNLSTYVAAWLGAIGLLLALCNRRNSGLLLVGIFLSLLGLHSLAGEELRYRLAAECIWIIGAAYALYSLSRLFKRSFSDINIGDRKPIHRSIFDSSIVKIVIPALLILPFVTLAFRIPINSGLKSQEKLAVLQKPVETVLNENGLLTEFRKQGSRLHEISHYKSYALSQPSKEKIRYPKEIVVFSGEISHIACGANRKIKNFSFNVNKAGLYVGDARLRCFTVRNISLILPVRIQKMKRAHGIVVGKIIESGPLGDIVIRVYDIIIENKSLKRI